MVFLKVKKTETDYFIVESKTDLLIDEIVREVVKLYNFRILLHILTQEASKLMEFGISKEPEKQLIDDVDDEEVESKMEKLSIQKKDPDAKRVGIPPEAVLQQKMKTCIEDAKSCLAIQQTTITFSQLREAFLNIKGSVMIAYPMGLPDYDPVTILLNEETPYQHPDMLDPETAVMWFAGKELHRDQKLMENKSIGRNEKTTIIVKLTKKGVGAPVRESPVTTEQQKELMAFYYKKQEENKKLLQDDDISFTNSAWADDKSLKKHFQGVANVGWRPK